MKTSTRWLSPCEGPLPKRWPNYCGSWSPDTQLPNGSRHAPADLLKLYIYGYLNRVRSSRRLEAETHRNIEVIWLLRHLKPDFKTIADLTATPSAKCSVSLWCSVANWICLAGSCWRWWHADQGGQQQGS